MSKHNRGRDFLKGSAEAIAESNRNGSTVYGMMRNDSGLLRRYERLYRYTSEIVLFLDARGVVLEHNEKSDVYFPGGITGKQITALFDGLDLPVDSIFNTEIVQSVFVRSSAETGNAYSFILSFIPIGGEENDREIMVLGKDLSEIESYKDEIESLEARLNEMEEEKRVIGLSGSTNDKTLELANALRKLERTKGEIEKINQTLTKELELAAVLQKSLVPHRFPEDPSLRFAFHYEPMQFVGGDYYDVIDLGGGRRGLIIADVSGHGVSSAFIAAMLKISFLNYAPLYQSPAEVLHRLNEEYCEVIQTGDFVTAFYGIIDPRNGRMSYCGAGHPRPLFLHRTDNTIEHLASEGFFIGMFDQAEYGDKSVEMRQGDRFMVFTDGIIEAFSDERGEQFGEKRLLACFKDCCHDPLDHMIANVIKQVKDFMKKSIFYDDLAIVAVEYRNPGDEE
jgi:serine phosphatase RsbU (regulator of sigma subunit)